MCGVAGVVGRGDDDLLRRMVACQTHRGPDDSGVEEEVLPDGRRVGLGSNRLSILDLSPAGRMPMSNEDGSVLVVHNGEIYNYRELRSELRSRGYRFRSGTDTEVILRLYEEEGVRAVRRLEGMFAFAVWDRRAGKITVARDRLGIKPLFYHQEPDRFVFASEIKALLQAGGRRAVDWDAAWDYFTYLHVPAPQTIYAGIRQLPPASLLAYDLESGELDLRRYWDPLERISGPPERRDSFDPREAMERLRFLMDRSVSRRLVADVPLGAFLSGGIDSSVVVGLMARHATEPVKTFTVLFTGAGSEFFNEKETADAVARRWGTDHHELSVDISEPEELLDLVSCFDQPFGNPTLYLHYLISRESRRHAKVALSGAGGDELFAGYPRYRAARWARVAGLVPSPLRSGLRKGLDYVPTDHSSPHLRRAKTFLDGLDEEPAERYARWVYFMGEEEKRRLLRPDRFAGATDSTRWVRDRMEEAGGLDWLGRLQYVDLSLFLPNNILAYTDATSMATSLEVRVPWLDHELAEFSLSLPARAKLRRGTTKWLVRQAFADLIPEETKRGVKKGFSPPLGQWMKSTLDRYFDTHLTPDYVEEEGIFRREYIESMRHRHRAGRRDYSMELFGIIMFDAWYRQYILRR